jgi:hypothetical protein
MGVLRLPRSHPQQEDHPEESTSRLDCNGTLILDALTNVFEPSTDVPRTRLETIYLKMLLRVSHSTVDDNTHRA